uniref:Uncharacterized protein n=1 Tax=viral metagenome TaxID=1070528 RepID=A0A6C0D263_9ZZZZ
MGAVNSKEPEVVLKELDKKFEELAKQNGTFTYVNPMYEEQSTQSRQSLSSEKPIYDQSLPKPTISDLKKLEAAINLLKKTKSSNEISRIISNYKYIYPILMDWSVIKNFKNTPRSDPLYENKKQKARRASKEIGLPPPS